MKIYFYEDYYPLDEIYRPIRSKTDIVFLVLQLSKHILHNPSQLKYDSVKTKIAIVVDKMTRLFIIEQKKIFSIHFPLTILLENGEIILTHNETIIEPQYIYSLLEFMYNYDLASLTLSEIYEYFNLSFNETGETSEFIIENYWSILLHIYNSDSSYIRYDIDDNKERLNEKSHPLNHLDVNYMNADTFKLGLRRQLTF